MTGGYVRLHRKLLEHPIWTQHAPAVAKVAIHFLLRANYRRTQLQIGNRKIDLPAGSFITSYRKVAKACRLSLQQVRDAFVHLETLGFSTSSGTHQWTLVTVLNWATYQARKDEEEHTESLIGGGNTAVLLKEHSSEHTSERAAEHTEDAGKCNQICTNGTEDANLEHSERLCSQHTVGCGNLKNGTTDKKYKNNKYSLSAGKPASVDGLLDINSTTRFDSEPGLNSEAVNGRAYSAAGKNGHCRAPKLPEFIQSGAAKIHARHPKVRRDIGVEQVGKKLAEILKHKRVPATEQEAYLRQIDLNHAALCASDAWQKEGGQYAKGLENWLAPSKERYDAAPSAESPDAMVPTDYYWKPNWSTDQDYE
jgi:hypothetical protein